MVFRDKELSLYDRCCEKYIWAMGILFAFMHRKVSFTSKKKALNAYTMYEMFFFFSESSNSGAAP